MLVNEKKFTVRKMIVAGILGGISAVLGLTPLGFIPVGPTRATIMHVPVIIGAIMEGPLVGGLIGLIFGVFSIFQALMNPTPVSFVFLNPLVSVIPRVLIGVISYYVYELFKELGEKVSFALLNVIWGVITIYLIKSFVGSIFAKKSAGILVFNGVFIVLTLLAGFYVNKVLKSKAIEVVVSSAIGTLANTVGVLSTIYFIYGQQYVEALGLDASIAGKVIFGIGITNGVPEVIVAVIIVTSVVASLKKRV